MSHQQNFSVTSTPDAAAFAHARLGDTLATSVFDDDSTAIGAWVDDDGRFFAVGGDDVVREYGDGPAEDARLQHDLHRDGRRHHPLRHGEDQAARDRRTGIAGPLPARQALRIRGPLDLAVYPVVGVETGDLAPLPVDPTGRHRPLRTNARAGLAGFDRPVVPAAASLGGYLSRRMGRERPAALDLPPLLPQVTRPDNRRAHRVEIALAILAALFVSAQFYRAWAAGSL